MVFTEGKDTLMLEVTGCGKRKDRNAPTHFGHPLGAEAALEF